MYNMVPYKLKVVNVKYDILNFSPIRKNRNSYPSEDNNCCDDSIMANIG